MSKSKPESNVSVAKDITNGSFFKFMKFGPYTRLSLFMLFKHKALFFAYKNVLNDPTDCSPHYYVDIDDKKIEAKLREFIAASPENVSERTKYAAQRAVDMIERDKVDLQKSDIETKSKMSRRSPGFYFSGEFYEKYSRILGEKIILQDIQRANKDVLIFSMSKKWDEARLWAHYADSHSGLCLEISGVSSTRDGLLHGHVDYTTRRPSVSSTEVYNVTSGTNEKQLEEVYSRMFLQKSVGWSYEFEHRMVLTKKMVADELVVLRLPEGVYVHFPKLKLNRIILGMNASQADQRLINMMVSDFSKGKSKPNIVSVVQNDDNYDISLVESEDEGDDFPF